MKSYILVIISMLFILSSLELFADNEQIDESKLKDKKILIIIADSFVGFEEPFNIFKRNGADMVIVSAIKKPNKIS